LLSAPITGEGPIGRQVVDEAAEVEELVEGAVLEDGLVEAGVGPEFFPCDATGRACDLGSLSAWARAER
jgi:hypothetical protein